jgi:hypothetical protein
MNGPGRHHKTMVSTMTFQSTILKASKSVITSKAIVPKTPKKAAMTVSITPLMTKAMLDRKTDNGYHHNFVHENSFFVPSKRIGYYAGG